MLWLYLRGSTARTGTQGLQARADDSAPVELRAVEALAVASGIGDVGGDIAIASWFATSWDTEKVQPHNPGRDQGAP